MPRAEALTACCLPAVALCFLCFQDSTWLWCPLEGQALVFGMVLMLSGLCVHQSPKWAAIPVGLASPAGLSVQGHADASLCALLAQREGHVVSSIPAAAARSR